jgi:hypothetical protein
VWVYVQAVAAGQRGPLGAGGCAVVQHLDELVEVALEARGEMISRMRAGVSLAFQKVCHCPRGLDTRSPGSANTTSSPRRAPTRPASGAGRRRVRWGERAVAHLRDLVSPPPVSPPDPRQVRILCWLALLLVRIVETTTANACTTCARTAGTARRHVRRPGGQGSGRTSSSRCSSVSWSPRPWPGAGGGSWCRSGGGPGGRRGLVNRLWGPTC